LRTVAAGVAWLRTRSRLVTGVGFTLVTVTTCVLLGQRLTHSSWPLAYARVLLVGLAALCYFASFILRARLASLVPAPCWTTRAVGSALLLNALGFAFSPRAALCGLCLSAAAGVIPITAGGAVANVGATAGILLALGAGKDIAINFSLASRLLLVTSAGAAALSGLALSVAAHALAGRRPAVLPA
jgi:hypothetical protein